MDMQGYVEYCKKMRSGSAAPRPRVPPVPRSHYDYGLFQDMRRIAFLRLQQHERIGGLITKEESDLILARKEEVLKDRKLLEDIAERSGVYIDLEVKDCIQQFLETRQRAERFHRFATEFGRGLPKTGEQQRAATAFMKRVEAEAELREALARRDVANCPLRIKLPWAGPAATCELTGLRYLDCCGRLSAGAAAEGKADESQLPPQLRTLKKVGPKGRPLPVHEQERERTAHVKFKGRAEGRLRKAFITASRPRFRDY
ncbi:hypothetical protein HYH03_003222 [Edaphochlamys debaryana]|uniref:Uncharacterized protein n=1 Tax=Edaphochlamys debaryana TaxID=47281 RepID=A0A835Y9Z5_9CHLO|nr:hypothetical protein HYH03_003222 [Edaphochlamys debaryana]|eukprot:KAG2499037.1 hypothetical protein HYH03_003222 [Edaphochlamys debaryana]